MKWRLHNSEVGSLGKELRESRRDIYTTVVLGMGGAALAGVSFNNAAYGSDFSWFVGFGATAFDGLCLYVLKKELNDYADVVRRTTAAQPVLSQDSLAD